MDFEKHISNYVQSAEGLKCQKLFLYVLRKDGVLVGTKSVEYDEFNFDDQSVGALSGGVWQAAQALGELISSNPTNEEVYRFSFDTSSNGVYLLPLNELYILGCLFSESVNPGYLKNELRKLKSFLVSQITETDEIRKDEDRLFENITDEEMDNLFSFAGN